MLELVYFYGKSNFIWKLYDSCGEEEWQVERNFSSFSTRFSMFYSSTPSKTKSQRNVRVSECASVVSQILYENCMTAVEKKND